MSAPLTVGVGSYTLASEPTSPHNGRSYLLVEKDNAVVLLFHPVRARPNANLISMILRLHTDGAWGLTPTITAQAPDGPWTGSGLTDDNQPGVTGAVTTVSHASNADADLFELDVTTQYAAMLAAGDNFGLVIKRTDAGASKAFYGFDSAFPPSLEPTWAVTPTPPTIMKPAGGRAVPTPLPPLVFDTGVDCQWIQVQVDAVGGDFSDPFFDSDWVPATIGKFYLAGSGCDPLTNAVTMKWRGQYKNSSGVESGYGPAVGLVYRPYCDVEWTYPSVATGSTVTSDDPLLSWDVSDGTQAQFSLQVAPADAPLDVAHDSRPQTTPTSAYQLPQGVILDSSIKIATLAVTDTVDREAVEGFPVEKIITQEFSFQPTAAVAPFDTLTVTQIGTSSFVLLAATRSSGRPDSSQIRRDGGIIAGTAETKDLRPDADGVYRWIDYTGAGNTTHHYRWEAKVGGKVSNGGQTRDIITNPKGKWLGDPTRQAAVLLGGSNLDDWDMGEVSALYFPLRGSDAVQVSQSLRGYEGPIEGDIKARDGVSAGVYYNALMAMRRNPDDTYVVAYPFVAFFAAFSHIRASLMDSKNERWDVKLQIAQQGTAIWLHGQTWLESSSTLLATHDYEEGANNAALTTDTDDGAVEVGGAPVYKSSAAVHGVMGFQTPAAADGGWVEYEVPHIGMASHYITPRTSGGSGGLAQLRPDVGAGTCCEFTLRSAGDLSIADEDGHTVDNSKTHGIYGWAIDKTIRIDTMWLWDNGEITVGMRLFDPPESNNPADQVQVTFPCSSAPGRYRAGNGSASKKTDNDSVRLYAGTAVWPSPLAPSQAEWLTSQPGPPTQTGITVRSRVLNTDTIDLAVSTTLTAGGDPETPTYYGPSNDALVDEHGLISHDIADQDPDTVYYAKLALGPDEFIGDLMKWTTLPEVGAAFTRKYAIVSCERNFRGHQTEIGWEDILDWDPDEGIHLGDADYQGGQYDPSTTFETLLEAYTAQSVGIPAMRQALARAGWSIMEDDHAFSANNGDSNDSTDTGKVRAKVIDAMQRMWPLYPLADDRPPALKRSLTGSRMLSKTVRLIHIDSESLDRSISTDADTAAKTFLGSEGDAYLRAQLVKPAALNLIICPKALLGDEDHGTPAADQVTNYNTWRSSLADFIASTQTTDGKDIFTMWIGGDRHAMAYASKADNPIMPGHPALISSGIEQFALDQRPGEEDYTESYGYGDHTLDIPVVQWLQLTITDTPGVGGAGTIDIDIQAREAENTFDVDHQTEPGTWTMTDGLSASDSWAYTAAPGDVLAPWAGDADQTTVKITGLFTGCTSVSLLVANNPAMSGATTISGGGAPDGTGLRKWAVTGLSAGTQYWYRYLDTFAGHFTNAPIGDVYTFKTLAATGGITHTTRIAVGSCGQTAPMDGAVWDDMLDDGAWVPDWLMHLGDFGYPGYLNTSQTTHKTNWANNLQDPGLGRAVRVMRMPYIVSDHDVNGHHHESNAANFHDAISQANMDAWVAVVPANVVDVRSPARARYRSYVEGKVRFVLLDTRSWDRTDVRENGTAPDAVGSTMLGSAQLTWLQAEIVAAQSASQVIVLFTDPAWNGTIAEGTGMTAGSIEASYSDKWPAYSFERDAISDYAAARGVDLFIPFGDSHLLQQDDGTNEKNGFASICCGPFDQNLHAHFQDSYQFNYPAGVEEGGGKTPQAQQYQRLTIAQTPTQVTITAEARDCTGSSGVTVNTLVKVYAV